MQRDPVETVVEQEHSQHAVRAADRLEDGGNADETEEEVGHGQRGQADDCRPLERLKFIGATSSTTQSLTTSSPPRVTTTHTTTTTTTSSSPGQHGQADCVADSTEGEDARDGDAVDETADVLR